MQLNAFDDIDESQGGELAIAAHLDSAKERWNARFQQRQLSLKLSIPKNPGSDRLAIPTRSLRQILDNLLSNMYRYARPDTQCRIEVSGAAQTRQVALRFSNETLDVTRDCLPYLFDRFYRVSRSRTRNLQETSTGLGLSIVRQLSLLHKGNATADLDDTRLIISVYLPLRDMAR